MKELSEFIGFTFELSMEKSKETEVTDSEDWESWLVTFHRAGGSSAARRSFFLDEDQSAFFVNDA